MIDKEKLVEVLRETGIDEKLVLEIVYKLEENKEEIFDMDEESDYD